VRCSALQRVAIFCIAALCVAARCSVLQLFAVCCRYLRKSLQATPLCARMHVAARCSTLQRDAVCCNLLKRVAVICERLYRQRLYT